MVGMLLSRLQWSGWRIGAEGMSKSVVQRLPAAGRMRGMLNDPKKPTIAKRAMGIGGAVTLGLGVVPKLSSLDINDGDQLAKLAGAGVVYLLFGFGVGWLLGKTFEPYFTNRDK